MRLAWHRSLAGRLFLLISLCLVGTVVGISWQNGAMFYKTLDRQVEDGSVAKAKEIAAATNSILDGWTSQVAVAMYALAGKNRVGLEAGLERLLGAGRDLVAVQIFDATSVGNGGVASAFKYEVGDVRYEATPRDRWRDQLTKAGGDAVARYGRRQGPQPRVSVLDLAGEAAKLPLVHLLIRFRSGASGPTWLVLASAWQTRLLAALPNSETTVGEVVHGDGTPILQANSTMPHELPEELREILEVKGSAFGLKAYTDEQGVPRLGALARLPDLDLVAVVLADARPSRLAVKTIIFQTAAWAWVFLLASLMLSYLSVSGVTRKLGELTAATLKIAGGDFGIRYGSGGKDEVGVLGASVNHMAGRIESLLNAQVAAARQEKELETARIVQGTLFPKTQTSHGPVVVSGRCQPASECGGDWWWHTVGSDGFHYVVIADAVGHGVGAALVTALAFSSTQTIMKTLTGNAPASQNLRVILQAINEVLWTVGSGDTLMTALAMAVDPQNLTVDLAAAGHQFPYLIRPSEEGRKVATRLNYSGSSPLGLTPSLSMAESSVSLAAGDKVFLYTDGLIECQNPTGKAWGRKHFEKAMRELATKDSTTLIDNVLSGAFQHFAGRPLDDDITVAIVEIRAEGAEMKAAS